MSTKPKLLESASIITMIEAGIHELIDSGEDLPEPEARNVERAAQRLVGLIRSQIGSSE